ncbi:hypothetical protein AVKW3434_23090 [Acidovorax sp. SUPP3434]|uniref:hypothetical protein n=1 Tax=Acidovorax sp. SUPP3434 TaxID=2920880 RepID=UPI0023DE64CA|nr:hypothetical protein [Acidovorax sp. SUPP3434]GKT02329.1 hypothetical protein AVKW3434_23090 [Acidovorax sp. SUPP3434]
MKMLSLLKKIPCIAWWLALHAALFLAWYVSTPTLYNRYNSPRYVYRVDIYHASWWQRITHPEMKKPAVVRLHRFESRALLGESPVVDLWHNDAIVWDVDTPGPVNRVHMGRDVVFEKLPSECTPPSPLLSCEGRS